MWQGARADNFILDILALRWSDESRLLGEVRTGGLNLGILRLYTAFKAMGLGVPSWEQRVAREEEGPKTEPGSLPAFRVRKVGGPARGDWHRAASGEGERRNGVQKTSKEGVWVGEGGAVTDDV